MMLILFFFSILFKNSIPTTLNCGQTLTSGLENNKVELAFGMFYGSVITIKGVNMNVKEALVSFRMFDSQSNTILLVNFGSSGTGFNYQIYGGQKGDPKRFSQSPIAPATGNYSVDFSINMDKTITITGSETYMFDILYGLDVAVAISFQSMPVSSVEYTCNCRAPNADKTLIAMCLGL